MKEITISNQLEEKITRLTETLGISTEELLLTAIEAFLNQRCDTEKTAKTEVIPKTKYTPSKNGLKKVVKQWYRGKKFGSIFC